MFSHEPRCVYRNNQLANVICQLRFPEILSIQANIPADFQEAIRHIFPKYAVRPEALPGKNPPANNYQFVTADGMWRINLTSKFISLSCGKYTCWEDFANMLDKPLAAFIQIYKPAYFERVGLRYVNFISRERLNLSDVPFRELMEASYLGTAELGYRAVDCHSSHDGNNTVFLLACVHVEQHLKCTSHNPILFGYKISYQRVVHCYAEYGRE